MRKRSLIIPAGIVILVAGYCFSTETFGNKLTKAISHTFSAQARESQTTFTPIPGDTPEAQLTQVFARIEKNQLGLALQQAEELTDRYPTFHLGQLVKGDLLLARAQPISTFGNVRNAPQGKLADLRAEALARLRAYRNQPPEDSIPEYLLQLQPDQKYAIVVDTQLSRLYLYKNDDGIPKLVNNYYITQGKLGADKMREGDQKTPLGVYRIVGNLPRSKIGDFYGSGAWPLNYPNDWDRHLGHNGHGIWLHGVPSDTYSRPPKASNGCVVLSNPDLNAVSPHLQIGITPVIIADSVDWLTPAEWKSERKDILGAIDSWRHDWESRNSERYASHYAKSFSSNGVGYAAWMAQKRVVNASKTWIHVDTDKLTLFRYPGKNDMVVATFLQDYKSNNLSNAMMKRQYWLKQNGQWKIIYEGSAG